VIKTNSHFRPFCLFLFAKKMKTKCSVLMNMKSNWN
jgi:hypothetical protein